MFEKKYEAKLDLVKERLLDGEMIKRSKACFSHSLKIKKIWAREILNSLGAPTIESTVVLTTDKVVFSSVPSGVSISKHEAVELRDGDPGRFHGMGVLKAVKNVNDKIGPKLVGYDPTEQTKIDQVLVDLDGKTDKSNLGANAILSVSQAVMKAGALKTNLPLYKYIALKYELVGEKITLPVSVLSLISGGMHGAGNLDFQEFHIVPSSKKTHSQGLRLGVEIYQTLKGVLVYRNAIHSLGDDGGFAPDLFTNADALEIIKETVKQTKYNLGEDVFLGLDVAASFLYKNEKYVIRDKAHPMTPDEMIEYYKKLNQEYHIFYLEDPLWEDDWKNWSILTKELGEETIVVGDDLLCTNKKRLQTGIKNRACTATIVRPNQIGTVSEAIEVVKTAKEAGWKVVVSHRSGETNDTFIADFAVGVGADYTKFGAPARGERIAKYNRFSVLEKEIEKELT